MSVLRKVWDRPFLVRLSRFGWQHVAFLLLQCIIAALALYFWQNLPEAGIAVALLAAVAAAMSVHAEMKGWQKAIWMLLIYGLLHVELLAIKKQANDSKAAAARALQQQQASFQTLLSQQNRDFQLTASSLEAANKESKSQFETSMQRTNNVLTETQKVNSLTAENLRSIIGDVYTPYFTLVNIADSNVWQLWLSNDSKHPIRNLQAEVRDVNIMLNLYESRTPRAFYLEDEQTVKRLIYVGDVGPGLLAKSSYNPTPKGKDIAFLRFQCSSLAGAWSEVLIVRRDASGRLYSAMAIPGGTAKVDAGFPRDAKGKIGWGQVGVKGFDE